ncbi:MAG: hypothetical protein WC712_06345 [Candidatus Brocadiia bacterium]
MSYPVTFRTTFRLSGISIEVDPDLRAELRDPLNRPVGTYSLADGTIVLDAPSLEYSVATDIAPLPAGPVELLWYANHDGAHMTPYPLRQPSFRAVSPAPRFGATVASVLERMRGLDIPDFAPLYGGASGTGEDVLGRFLDSAATAVTSALPAALFPLLTGSRLLLTPDAPLGSAVFQLPAPGEIASCAIYVDGASTPLSPSTYTLDGKLLSLRTPLVGGERVEVDLTWSGSAPLLLADLVTAIAAAESALSLVPPSSDARSSLMAERANSLARLASLGSGSLVPAEWRALPLPPGGPFELPVISFGQFRTT